MTMKSTVQKGIYVVVLSLAVVALIFVSLPGKTYIRYTKLPVPFKNALDSKSLNRANTVDVNVEDTIYDVKELPVDFYAENDHPVTVFDSDKVVNTTIEIHNRLYNKKGNATCKQQFPTCILLGVYKSGTRELMDFISLHPNVQIKRNPYYEFGYFFSPKYLDGGSAGLNWFREQLPCIYDDQVTMMKHAGYFESSIVPQRIYKFNKDVKLVVIVREPIQRFISHVWFLQPTSSLSTITRMIENAISTTMTTVVRPSGAKATHNGIISKNTSTTANRIPGQDIRHKLTIRNSKVGQLLRFSVYDEPFKRYMKYFRRDQILVLEGEEFKHEPASVLYKIENFLGLPHRIHKDMFVYNEEKRYYCLRSFTGDHICYDSTRGRPYKKELKNSTLQKLKEYFRPHNERFFDLIGERFDHWN